MRVPGRPAARRGDAGGGPWRWCGRWRLAQEVELMKGRLGPLRVPGRPAARRGDAGGGPWRWCGRWRLALVELESH